MRPKTVDDELSAWVLPSGATSLAEAVVFAEAIAATYEGPNGLLEGNVAGKLFIEMSTVQPATQAALAVKVRSKGAALIDCPVGGSVGPAKEGKLFGSVGVADVAAAIHEQFGVEIDRRTIGGVDEPWKEIGSHEVTVRLHADVIPKVIVNIVGQD